jgi:hypothetical protein
MGKADPRSAYQHNRTICLPISQEKYDTIVSDAESFRKYIDTRLALSIELFPTEIKNGYRMKDFYFSKKLSIWIRRIEIADVAYTIRPSFAMPYMTAIVDDVEKGLFLKKVRCSFLCEIGDAPHICSLQNKTDLVYKPTCHENLG